MRNKHMKYLAGLTLIELMTVIAIISILAGIGWPVYQETSQRSKREGAMSALLRAQGFMEKCYSKTRNYAGCVLPAGTYPAGFTASVNGYYNIDIMAGSTATTYTLRARPAAGGPQVSDTNCAAFMVSNTGQKTSFDDGSPAVQTTNCWPR